MTHLNVARLDSTLIIQINESIFRLDGSEWLNDVIINTYCELYLNAMLQAHNVNGFIVSTQFMLKLYDNNK